MPHSATAPSIWNPVYRYSNPFLNYEGHPMPTDEHTQHQDQKGPT